MSVAAYARAP